LSELLVESAAPSAPTELNPAVAVADAVRVAAFRSALRGFLRTSEQIAQANGLTPRRHLLLLMIKGAPDGSERATISELAERLQLAQTTVTELAQRAVDAGLVVRERSSTDARVVRFRVSEEGERRLASVFRSHDAERERLLELLNRHETTAPTKRHRAR
jgi:DNA-binding MarR family transcriptional regulator